MNVINDIKNLLVEIISII